MQLLMGRHYNKWESLLARCFGKLLVSLIKLRIFSNNLENTKSVIVGFADDV